MPPDEGAVQISILRGFRPRSRISVPPLAREITTNVVRSLVDCHVDPDEVVLQVVNTVTEIGEPIHNKRERNRVVYNPRIGLHSPIIKEC
jgi:hypothetical protein